MQNSTVYLNNILKIHVGWTNLSNSKPIEQKNEKKINFKTHRQTDMSYLYHNDIVKGPATERKLTDIKNIKIGSSIQKLCESKHMKDIDEFSNLLHQKSVKK